MTALILLVLLAITFFVYRFLMKLVMYVAKPETENSRTILVVGSFLIFYGGLYLALTWDELLALHEYKQLCAKEGGVKIYSKIELNDSFYEVNGAPNFYTGDKVWGANSPNFEKLSGVAEMVETSVVRRGYRLPSYQLINKANGQVAAEYVFVSAADFRIGWIRQFTDSIRLDLVTFPRCSAFDPFLPFRDIFVRKKTLISRMG
jgi:hypothetical protein